MFVDLRGFTAFTDAAEPEEVQGVLGEFHATMGALITRFQGTIDRFAGDGILMFFNDPIAVPDAPRRAAAMALDMQAQFAPLRARWSQLGYDLDLGIGIAKGFATLGAFGYESRFDYSAIGGVVNLAARLCDEAARADPDRPAQPARRSTASRRSRRSERSRSKATYSLFRRSGYRRWCDVAGVVIGALRTVRNEVRRDARTGAGSRRTFVAATGALAALAAGVRAQPRPVIGFLNSATPQLYEFNVAAFREGLQEAGFIDGKNLTIEFRWAEGHYDRLPVLARELVDRGVAAIAATGDVSSAQAAQAATRTTPIVFTIGGDPVKFGLVESYNRPGRNLTGINLISSAMGGKRVELLHELAPRSAIALPMNPDNPNAARAARCARSRAGARALHVLLNATAAISTVRS